MYVVSALEYERAVPGTAVPIHDDASSRLNPQSACLRAFHPELHR